MTAKKTEAKTDNGRRPVVLDAPHHHRGKLRKAGETIHCTPQQIETLRAEGKVRGPGATATTTEE